MPWVLNLKMNSKLTMKFQKLAHVSTGSARKSSLKGLLELIVQEAFLKHNQKEECRECNGGCCVTLKVNNGLKL